MSVGYQNNRKVVVLNPIDSSLEVHNEVSQGVTTRNNIIVSFTIKGGWSHTHPNMGISDVAQVDVEDGGELIII